jgi:hypothetical protein
LNNNNRERERERERSYVASPMLNGAALAGISHRIVHTAKIKRIN